MDYDQQIDTGVETKWMAARQEANTARTEYAKRVADGLQRYAAKRRSEKTA